MGYPAYNNVVNLQPVRRLISTVRRLISLVITTLIIINEVSSTNSLSTEKCDFVLMDLGVEPPSFVA